MVQSGARHLLSLINDLLDLARLGANKLELNLEPLDCGILAAEVAATLRPQAERKGLGFALHLPARPLALRTDRRAFSQILLNLLGNAIKFTTDGSVSVHLEHGAEGETVTLS